MPEWLAAIMARFAGIFAIREQDLSAWAFGLLDSARRAKAGDKPERKRDIDTRFGSPSAVIDAARSAGGNGAAAKPFAQLGSVALIDVWGVLDRTDADVTDPWDGSRFGTSYESIANQVHAASNDDSVRSILMRFDSPGGSVAGLSTVADQIHGAQAKKPVIAYADGLMASAALWNGSQATRLIASPSAWVGSIGVITNAFDISGLLDKWGIKVNTIKSTPSKDAGSPYRPMSEQDRALIQKDVNEYDRQFRSAVARGRGADPAMVSQWQSARGYIGQQAVDASLADGVMGSVESVIAMAEATGGDPRKLMPRKSGMGGAKTETNPAAVVVAGVVGNGAAQGATGHAPGAAGASGEAAEGSMNPRLLLGIAGLAAGVGPLLDPNPQGNGGGNGGAGGGADAGGGAGGGGGTATATGATTTQRVDEGAIAARERERIESIDQRAEHVLAFAGVAGDPEKAAAVKALVAKARKDGWSAAKFADEAVMAVAPKPGGFVAPAGARDPGATVQVGAEQSEKYEEEASLALVSRTRADLFTDVPTSDNPVLQQRAEAQRRTLEAWNMGSAADARKRLAGSSLARLTLKSLAMRAVAARVGGADKAFELMQTDSVAFMQVLLGVGRFGATTTGGISRGDFPNILSNYANKNAVAGFNTIKRVWQDICATGTANDYKPTILVQRGERPKFRRRSEGAPPLFGTMKEFVEYISVESWQTPMRALTLEAIANDDLSMLQEDTNEIGEMAALIPEELVINEILLSNAGAGAVCGDGNNLFDAANHNNLVDPGTALAYDSIQSGWEAMVNQTNDPADPADVDYLSVEPDRVLTDVARFRTARDLYNQEYQQGTPGQQNQSNPVRGMFQPLWTPRVGITPAFWLFPPPGPQSPIQVNFFNGQQMPRIAQLIDGNFMELKYMAVVLGCGAGLRPRAWKRVRKNKGA